MILDGNSKLSDPVIYKNSEDFLLKKLAEFLKVLSSSQPTKISVSFIQRKLNLGYNDADSFLIFLIREKLISDKGKLLIWVNLPPEN